ncbi:sensor histidine kinase NtrY-like [Microvirga lotononidis]|uniref:histidine kinase n=1 Tax=Microvirga lotononidis TaxID=864069 RepID=I4Z0L6_9HYPH|nr:PAS domain-containing sensor histidine kinase [Microvirga lotononidis]EIM29758.1 PAS domain S-box [Microvirga lotononidis]WQO26942.1 PAS domain-containing sensor histidine kinase [Microvirga lotononidis]
MIDQDTIAQRQAAETSQSGLGWLGYGAVLSALASALATFLILAGATPLLPTHNVVVWVFLLNGALIALLLGIVAWQTRKLVRERRAGAAAAGLHVRIVGLFSLVAVLPAILVAAVATVTLERGLDPWFTGALKDLMTNTVSIARSYREVQCRTLARETQLMAADLNRAKVLFDADRNLFREFMNSRAVFLGFPLAMIVDADGSVVERIDAKKLENVPLPTETDLKEASNREALCLFSKTGNIFRSALKLDAHGGRILYVAREVDPRALEFPQVAEAGVAFYEALDQKKAGIQIAFASMFTLIALIVLLSAVWFGLNFANRLVAPIRRLIHATDQVATGNFYVQVPVKRGEGDLGHLGETFNKMTSELRRQHDGLTAASDLMDRRRRFTEAVLAGVSAGVIGVNARGQITIVNPSTEALLGTSHKELLGQPITMILPEVAPLVEEMSHGRQRLMQQQIHISRKGKERTINVRVTSEQARGGQRDLVITLDDITDLVLAQRTSAWADVARRIAHEIKNPLTPIQLSAERIRRKYGKVITTDREVFDQCTDTIVRQVDDIKRMVDEFSSFARMPKPTIGDEDLAETIRQVIFMMKIAHPEIEFVDQVPPGSLIAPFDRRLVSQAVTNIVKNATEAIAAVPEEERGQARISVLLDDTHPDYLILAVTDNGKGFPVEGRQRLLEPYMTTREGGTGLGLPIVAKILEDHGGGMELADNPTGRGGQVRMWIPKTKHVVSEEASAASSRNDSRRASL